MKNWLKMFKGEIQSSSDEIRMEIEDLEKKKEEKSQMVDRLTTDLKTARLDKMGGVNNDDDILSIEKSFTDAKNDLEILNDAIVGLSELYKKTIEKEKIRSIQFIDAEILSLQEEKKEITEKFLSLAGEAAGLWEIISAGGSFSAGRRTVPISGSREKNGPFLLAFNKANNDRRSIPHVITELRLKRKALVAELPMDVNRKLGLNKTAIA